MRQATITSVLALCLLSGACSREEKATPGGAPAQAGDAPSAPAAAAYSGHDYTCTDGSQVHALLAAGNLVVSIGGQSHTLSPSEGSSGANYSGEGITFIPQGDEAMLARDGASMGRCTAQ